MFVSEVLNIRNKHTGSVPENIGKYRAAIDKYGWEIRKSDGASGILEAIKLRSAMELAFGISDQRNYVLKLSCYEKDKNSICAARLFLCYGKNRIFSNCLSLADKKGVTGGLADELKKNGESKQLKKERTLRSLVALDIYLTYFVL